MDRSSARALAEDTLVALGLFQAVIQGPPDTFGGMSPIAAITSRSMGLESVARELYTIENGVSVSIYVLRTDPATAEDTLDMLTHMSIVALHLTGSFLIGESNADPAGGYQRIIDGKVYRVERIPLTVLDEG